ncbi:MAG: extracellular solute-binding protein [Alkalispirochaetaceae bacterium]
MQRTLTLTAVLVLLFATPLFAGGAAEEEAENEEIQLNVLVGHWTVGSDDSPFEAAKAELESRYPNVTVVFDVQQGGGNVKSKFLNSAAANESPDVAMVDSVALGEMVEAGLLEPIDEYVAEWDEYEDILPNFQEAGSWDGDTYSVFMNTDLRVLVWNKALFEEAGLDPEVGPSDWDELLEFAEEVNDPPGVYGMMVPGGSSEHTPNRWYSFLWGAGGSIVDNGRAAFNSDAGIEAGRFYQELIESGVTPEDVLSASADDNDRGVANGAYAMGVVGSWFFNYAREAGMDTPDAFNEAFGVSPIPGPDGGQSPASAGGWTVAIPSGSQHKDLAWEFISIAMNQENHRTWSLSRGYVPVRETLSQDSAFNESIPFFPVIEEALPNANTRPAIPEYGQISSAVLTAIQSIMLGEAGVEEALDAAAEQVDAALR